MWKWVERSGIDDNKWNDFVNKSDHFRHYYLTYFLDAAAQKWGALIWADYEMIWPVPFKRYPVSQAYQPLTMQQLGPIAQREIPSDRISHGILLLNKRFWRVEIKFNNAYSCKEADKGHQGRNIELILHKSIDALRKEFNRNVLSNLSKANKAGLKVNRQKEFVNDAVLTFRKGRGAGIKTLNKKFYHDVESVYNAFASRNEAETWVATIANEPVAYALALTTNGRILNFFTATKAQARNTGAMHATFDAIISHYSEMANTLDFEGSNDENLAFFYKGFGGVKVLYDHYQSGWQLPL